MTVSTSRAESPGYSPRIEPAIRNVPEDESVAVTPVCPEVNGGSQEAP
jgi:hypothetical protein